MKWKDLKGEAVQGHGWVGSGEPWCRLPVAVLGRVRPEVAELSWQTAGLYYDLEVTGGAMSVRWDLLPGRELSMGHMPATGVSGLDVYEWVEGSWVWRRNLRPTAKEGNELRVFAGREPERRRLRLYLPLYNGITALSVGTDGEVYVMPVESDPVVIYGTSITQGACASRPGLAYPSLLGRWLGVPIVNLGFSGNGRAEPEIAELLVGLRARLLVIDCLSNILPETAEEVLERFLEILAEGAPDQPLVLIGNLDKPSYYFSEAQSTRWHTVEDAARRAFELPLKKNPHLPWEFWEGNSLLGEDREGTVDGTHPNDLGFYRMAEALLPRFRKCL